MKLVLNVECTPEEARSFLGLPDVTPINEMMVDGVRERMQANIELMDPKELMTNWMTMGNRMTDQFMQTMTSAASAATGDKSGGG